MPLVFRYTWKGLKCTNNCLENQDKTRVVKLLSKSLQQYIFIRKNISYNI